jgi:hypothetical protein
MLSRLLLIACFLLVPSAAFAWGPLTHVYLGSEIFYLSSLLPAAVYGLIRKYRQDYLYGNLTADIILAKKYLSSEKHSHNWDVALGLMESSRTKSEEAFSLGYMSHLAADTVAHGSFTAGSRPLHHTFLELRADSAIDREYWFQAVAIERKVQVRNDAFLERSLERVIFSFKTNKRIFKGAVALSWLNSGTYYGFIDRNLVGLQKNGELEVLHDESLDRIVDVLRNGARSEVLKKDPIGKVRRAKVLKAFLK